MIGLLWALGTFAAWLVCSGVALIVWRFVVEPAVSKAQSIFNEWYWL